MGFDPYRRIRRRRTTRLGDLAFLFGFLAVTAGLIVWALW